MESFESSAAPATLIPPSDASASWPPDDDRAANRGHRRRLADALRGRKLSDFERRLIAVLHHDVFRRVDDLRNTEECALSYKRLRYLRRELGLTIGGLFANFDHMLALHYWVPLVDGTLTTLLTIHFNLCIGSILQHRKGGAALQPILDELERMDSIGVFLATELAYGNNVQALETEAIYEHATREFVIDTPRPQAQKFMPNTGAEGIAKLAVVLARLTVRGKDCGVFPFVVRIRTAEGLCEGVRVTPLGDKPGYALDNAMTSFDRVRIPFEQWLSGDESGIDADGAFQSVIRSGGRRFLKAMDRVQTGKLCLAVSALAMMQGALQLTVNYAQRRTTFGPGRADVPIMDYQPYQQAMLERVAVAYVCSAFLDHVATQYKGRSSDDDPGVNRLLALGKIFASRHGLHVTSTCRERLGAQGLFCANRVITYWVGINGVVTAEGDNEVIAIRAARELLFGKGQEASADASRTESIPVIQAAEFLIWLVREHERMLRQHLVTSLAAARQGGSLFGSWNDHLSDAIRLVHLHTTRLALDCMLRRIDEQEDLRARAILDRLLRLFALTEIESSCVPLITAGLIDHRLAQEIPLERKRIVRELAADASVLVDAFAIPSSLLDAPIGDDYVEAYHRMSTSPPPRMTFIRGVGTAEGEQKVGT